MRRYLTPRLVLGHVVVAAVAVTFLRLGWWQWEHARQGNAISYGYALQWPLFAAFGVFFWVRLVRDGKDRSHRGSTAESDVSTVEDSPQPSSHAGREPGPNWEFHRAAG